MIERSITDHDDEAEPAFGRDDLAPHVNAPINFGYWSRRLGLQLLLGAVAVSAVAGMCLGVLGAKSVPMGAIALALAGAIVVSFFIRTTNLVTRLEDHGEELRLFFEHGRPRAIPASDLVAFVGERQFGSFSSREEILPWTTIYLATREELFVFKPGPAEVQNVFLFLQQRLPEAVAIHPKVETPIDVSAIAPGRLAAGLTRAREILRRSFRGHARMGGFLVLVAAGLAFVALADFAEPKQRQGGRGAARLFIVVIAAGFAASASALNAGRLYRRQRAIGRYLDAVDWRGSSAD